MSAVSARQYLLEHQLKTMASIMELNSTFWGSH